MFAFYDLNILESLFFMIQISHVCFLSERRRNASFSSLPVDFENSADYSNSSKIVFILEENIIIRLSFYKSLFSYLKLRAPMSNLSR